MINRRFNKHYKTDAPKEIELPAVYEGGKAGSDQTPEAMSHYYTSIDYPVARNQQPGYYLNHTFMRTKNPSGCLFVQEDAPKPGNGNMVIFGHNMKDGTMFADLKRYMKPGFYKAHSSIQLHYKGKWYKAVIYSIQLRNETDLQCYETEFLRPSEKTEFIRKMKKSSMYETSYLPTSKDGLITLSTCYGSMERMIVQAALICYTND